jgi:hypothetical protein
MTYEHSPMSITKNKIIKIMEILQEAEVFENQNE